MDDSRSRRGIQKTSAKTLCLLIHANKSGAESVGLHQVHYAHGGVRDVNIMFRKDGKPGLILIDFAGQGS